MRVISRKAKVNALEMLNKSKFLKNSEMTSKLRVSKTTSKDGGRE